ncbi:5' nucleotidase, NT5C type [Alkaliphilus transvaalensis]|uniref:5' nucleotidase, NT5C type n=1 Tax=Alkaliphilus transvaalensis TaxID=114628 RepID=UPI00047EBF5E|nr:nucleotidase [Alkaliphilus transvaalensis]
MKKLNLCIDIDGTITEAYDWIPRANSYFNTNITAMDVKVYDIHQNLGVERKAYDEFYRSYGEILHDEVTIRAGAKEVLDELAKDHQIHFVTAREERMRDVTNKWLKRHLIPLNTLSLLGSHNKIGKAIELSCDIFIEDRYENAIQLASSGFQVLLINCYYNQEPLPPQVTRVNNWFEIKNVIEEYTQYPISQFKIAT